MLPTIEYQADVPAFVIGALSLVVTSYIALLLHRLSKKFSQGEATRSINTQWDTFHTAMLSKEVHDLFWNFMRSQAEFTSLGDRAHHIVLMYLNCVHTEYSAYRNKIFDDFDPAYLDRLLAVFVPKRDHILQLARDSGYDDDFLKFLADRLSRGSA